MMDAWEGGMGEGGHGERRRCESGGRREWEMDRGRTRREWQTGVVPRHESIAARFHLGAVGQAEVILWHRSSSYCLGSAGGHPTHDLNYCRYFKCPVCGDPSSSQDDIYQMKIVFVRRN